MLSWPETILFALAILCFTFTLVTAMRLGGKAEDRKLRARALAVDESREARLVARVRAVSGG